MTEHLENNRIIQWARNFCRKPPHAFASDHKLLEATCLLFELRQSAASEAIAFHRQVCTTFHKCLTLSSDNLRIVHSCKHYKFSRTEIELLLLLMISEIGVCAKLRDLEDIGAALQKTGAHMLSVARLLRSDGRLRRSGLIETEVCFKKIRHGISPEFISDVLGTNTCKEPPVKTYDDAIAYTETIFDAASEQLSGFEFTLSGNGRRPENARKRVEKLLDRFLTILAKHPAWPLSHEVHCSHLNREEVLMVLMLLGIELGFSTTDEDGFNGHELAKCISATRSEIRRSLALLRNDHRLRKNNFVQIRGNKKPATDEPEDITMLRDGQFELTDEFLHTLKIKRRCKKNGLARRPMIQAEQLVLSEHVTAAFDMCIAQAQNAEVLFTTWGFKKLFSYGTAMTILLSGPPGTGKTACAEALAARLGKHIIVVNYAEMQSKWVGETEANIVKIFRAAAHADAVLFWDEAEAMFYDRDSALRTWEIRHVNVLLQSLERFEGICILSTNRKVTLDTALERRIAIKIEFERPDKEQRLCIWKKLIPSAIPLAADVSIEQLSREDLSGGEIKNVLLNAARISLCRTAKGPLTMQDFTKAIKMEKNGSWTRTKQFGFGRKE